MTEKVTRREFVKIAGSTAAGVAIATSFSPFSYAANEKVRVACIGTGGQGSFHIKYGLTTCPDIEIVALCDVYKPHLKAAYKKAGGEDGKDIKQYMDYRKMLEEVEFDAVIIATPLYTHYQIVMDCLDAGKHVFCEKTLAYNIEECRDIVKKVHETGKVLQVGHQRRYNPEYNKAVWLARGSEGRRSVTGRINHITAQWHRNSSWRRPVPKNYVLSAEEKVWIDDLEKHINWRLYPERSRGGLITELATHQLDVANWFLGTMPSRVAAFGGIDYWKDGREVNDNIAMIYEYEVDRDDDGFEMIPPRNTLQKRSQINRGYTVRMTYSSICASARRDYNELFQGDRGNILVTEQKGCAVYPEPAARGDWNKVEETTTDDAQGAADAIIAQETRAYKDEAYHKGVPIEVLNDRGVPFAASGVYGVDRMQFQSFANDIRTGGKPKANEIVGLMTAIAGFSAVKAMETGSIVEIDPALAEFDFKTPDPFRYDFFEEDTTNAKKEEEEA
jgi:predicted dehydrogenase